MRALKIRLHEGTYRRLADEADMLGTPLAALIRLRLESPDSGGGNDQAISQKIEQSAARILEAIAANSGTKNATPDGAILDRLERLERLLKSRASREESVAILEALMPFHQDQTWKARLQQIAQAILSGQRPPLMTQPAQEARHVHRG